MTRPRHLLLTLITAVLALMTTACIDDSVTNDSSARLTFSTDTVSFDTVITEQGSPTKQMIVYNRNSKAVNISRIAVAGEADKGRFFINVDGVKGDVIHDIEIRARDSIYVFIECRIDELDQDEPLCVTDKLDFELNGNTQQVTLEAWGQDVVRVTSDTIKVNTVWTAAKPYLIYDTLFVASDATLTLDAGTTLLFHDKAAMRVAGRLMANGTPAQPVTLRGDRLDHVVGEIDFEIMSGQWGGVIFTPSSRDNELRNLVMTGSSIGMQVTATDTLTRALYLHNCVLHNSSTSVFTTDGAWVDAVGTEFSDAALGVVNLIGGKVNLAQCTMANFYLFKAPSKPIVNFVENDTTRKNFPRLHAYLDNCIIYGMSKDVSMGDLTDTNIYLRWCLLRSPGSDDANFIHCLWDSDPLFYVVRDEYIFDYRIQNESPAIGAGNRSLCPDDDAVDFYGVNRFTRGNVDLGAYTWVPSEEPSD